MDKNINQNSILLTVKEMLGPSPYYDEFDTDILTLTNGAFAYLTRLGCGPPEGFYVEDETQTWDDYVPKSPLQSNVKQYVVYSVKLIFDPPLNSTVLESYKQMASEYEWRLNTEDDIIRHYVPEEDNHDDGV